MSHQLKNLQECIIDVEDLTSIRDKAFQYYINRYKPHLTSRFCKVELNLKSTS